MNIKSISLYVGKALFVNALFMFFSVLVSLFYGMDSGFTPLLISAVITFVVGVFPMIFVKNSQPQSLKEGFLIIVLSWLLSFVFGMLPYVLYGGEFTVMNAWFESVSGYTTTGSTILTDIEALPKSLLFWRSSTHYIGGLGVIVFLLLIMPDSSTFKHRLSNMDISSMSRDGYHYKSGKTVRVMLMVYILLTIAEFFALWGAGMTPFDAINHSFSTIATGGFSTKNTSIMYYDSLSIDLILIVFMILSSIHFGVLFLIFAKRSLRPLTGDVTKYYLSVFLIISVLVMITLLSQGGYSSWGNAAVDSAFQVSSFISTTGFGNADNASWPVLANLFLLFVAFHCGCSGSTTGGIKADRMLVVLRAFKGEFHKRIAPSSMFRVRIDGAALKDDAISSVFQYIVIYLLILFLSFCLVLASGVEVGEAFSGTLSSLGNVGPAMDGLGTMGSYSSQPLMAKFIYSLDMILGRLEIFPIFIVVSMIFRRK